ncbi:MAG TPA: DUF3597 domain-containing protein [Croceibacterium sp.]|nr:DUF3597 domain-containing protein [Croceibacterium sp.]
MRILSSIRDGVYGSRRREPLEAGEATPVGRSPEAEPRSTEPHAIDIENHLDSMPGADHLNWRTSIADLMTLIGVDSSVESREALAGELGYDGPLDGSRDMDNWLHAHVMADLAGQGGNTPPEYT